MKKLFTFFILLLLITGNFLQQPLGVFAKGGGVAVAARGGGFAVSAARAASVASVARGTSVASSTGARGMSAARSASIFASGRPSPGAISASSSIGKSPSMSSSLSVESGRTAPYGSASGSRSSSYAVPVFVGGYHGGGGGEGYYRSSGSSGSFVGAQNGTFRSVDNQDRERLSAALLAATVLIGSKYIVQNPNFPIPWGNRSLYWDAEFIRNETSNKDSKTNTMICQFPLEKVANNGSEESRNSSAVFNNVFIKKNTTDVSSSSNENNDDLRRPELAWRCDGQREVCCWLDCCPAADFPVQDCGEGDEDDCAASGAETIAAGLVRPLILVTTLFTLLPLILTS